MKKKNANCKFPLVKSNPSWFNIKGKNQEDYSTKWGHWQSLTLNSLPCW